MAAGGLLAQPVGAQAQGTNPICQDETGVLADMVEGFIQITTGLGIMGLLVVWQGDTLLEMFALGHESRQRYKKQRNQAAKSAITLIVLGPLFALFGTMMGIPIADCVSLLPF